MAGQCRVISDRRFESERNPSDHRLLLATNIGLMGSTARDAAEQLRREHERAIDRKTEIAVLIAHSDPLIVGRTCGRLARASGLRITVFRARGRCFATDEQPRPLAES